MKSVNGVDTHRIRYALLQDYFAQCCNQTQYFRILLRFPHSVLSNHKKYFNIICLCDLCGTSCCSYVCTRCHLLAKRRMDRERRNGCGGIQTSDVYELLIDVVYPCFNYAGMSLGKVYSVFQTRWVASIWLIWWCLCWSGGLQSIDRRGPSNSDCYCNLLRVL